MANKEQARDLCKSVFKGGEGAISKSQFTRVWIELINRIEKGKSLSFAKRP